MSDGILSGLRANGDTDVDEAWNDCLADVAEALTNPTDETVQQISRKTAHTPFTIRAVLAAAAGGDQ